MSREGERMRGGNVRVRGVLMDLEIGKNRQSWTLLTSYFWNQDRYQKSQKSDFWSMVQGATVPKLKA